MAKHFNITGASSAAAELTQELLAPGDGVGVSSIALTNVHASTTCKVDLYIEKKLDGKYYILNKGASETPAVDVILR